MRDWKQGHGCRFDIQELLAFLASGEEESKCRPYKFVKVKGEWRFLLFDRFAGHADLVDESEYPDIEAAGNILIHVGYWTLIFSMSMTLCEHNANACAGQAEIDELTKLLGRPHRNQWETA